MYTTLAQVRTELSAQSTVDDNELYAKIRAISRRVDRLFQSNRAVFAPVTETRPIPLMNENIRRGWRIYTLPGGIKNHLLSLTSVSINGTSVSGASLHHDTPNSPAAAIQLPQGTSWQNYCNAASTPPYITITGVWGWHPDYASAWEDEDALQADINSSVTSLTVGNVDGADTWGETPRISAGNLLKINDEIMLVTATDTATNVVTVRRAMNGTTATAHTSGDSVAVWQPDPPLKLYVARQVGAQYAKQGGYNDMEISGGATRRGNPTWLPELLTYLNGFNYEH